MRNEEKGSLIGLCGLAGHRANMEVWIHMKDVVLEGGNQFHKVHGMSIVQYMDADPTYNKVFNEAMAGQSTVVTYKVLSIYNGFEGLKSLVDVGGGTGRTLVMIVSKDPSIKGINFDLPRVTISAPPYPGIEHVGGNLFAGIPEGDAIIIKDSCHNWSDELCIKLLKNCYEVLPGNGKVIILSAILSEEPQTSLAAKFVSGLDSTMLAHADGRERTAIEFQALCKASGFSKFYRDNFVITPL